MTIWYEASLAGPQNRKLFRPTVGDLPHTEINPRRGLARRRLPHRTRRQVAPGRCRPLPETHGFDVNIGGTLLGRPDTFFFPYRGSVRFGPRVPLRAASGVRQTGRIPHRPAHRRSHPRDRPAGDRPFFLYLAFHSVHTPIEAKPETSGITKGSSAPASTPERRVCRHGHSLDENVGRVLDRLEE